jgi:hypothetical protein
MKQFLLLVTVMTVVASCGADNKVNSGAKAPVSGSNGVEVPLTNFEGDYYLQGRDRSSFSCSPAIRIATNSQCGGYILSGQNQAPEEFCNINKGESRDNRPFSSNNNTVVVTQTGNELLSTVRVGPNAVFTNKLTLSGNTLFKSSKLKGRFEECTYQKDR